MPSPLPPRLPAGERLRRAGIAAWSIIGLAIVMVGSVWALFRISIIFPPLVLALLIIYTLNPVVSILERRNVPRAVGAIGSYTVVAGVVTLVIFLLAPVITAQVENFSEDWPRFRDDLVTVVDDTADSINESLGTDLRPTQFDCLLGADESTGVDGPSSEKCDEVTSDLRRQLTGQASRITEFGSSVLEVLLVFIIGPLIGLYLLIDLPQLQRDLLNLVPESHREEFADVGSKIGRAVGGFFRGQLLVAVIVGVLSAIGFAIIDLPFWFLIGAIAGFFNLIPLVGPFIGGALGFLVGTVTGGVGLGLQAALVELIVQQLDNHFISPHVMRRTVKIHPVTVMLALLAGGALSGFWGVLLAVPTVAVVKLTFGHLWETRVLGAEVSPYSPATRPAARPATPPDEDEETKTTTPS